jgi:hypothetical protein
MRKEVYSWRVSTEIKSDLEREARIRRTSVSALLDMAVREWMRGRPAARNDDQEQQRLHAALENCVGTVTGRNRRRSETARESIRKRLRRRHGR